MPHAQPAMLPKQIIVSLVLLQICLKMDSVCLLLLLDVVNMQPQMELHVSQTKLAQLLTVLNAQQAQVSVFSVIPTQQLQLLILLLVNV